MSVLLVMLAAALSPAMPSGYPGAWLSDADYPPGALRRKEEGQVSFSLLISPEGRIVHCKITGSSGYPDLDERTCEMVKSRSRFKAASEENGHAIHGSYRAALTWRLPGRSGGTTTRYAEPSDMILQVQRLPDGAQETNASIIAKIDTTGHIAACEQFKPIKSSPQLAEVACQQAKAGYEFVIADADGKPVTAIRILSVAFKVKPQ